MKYLLILAAAAFAIFSTSCDDDDVTSPDPADSPKRIKTVNFSDHDSSGGPKSFQYEYDNQGNISNVLLKYWDRVGIEDSIIFYDVILDNSIYDDNKILSIDFFNTLDSSSGKINYVYNGDQITISNESDNPQAELHVLNIDYTNQKVHSITSKNSYDEGNSYDEPYTASVNYLDDSTMTFGMSYESDEPEILYADVDKDIENPLNIYNIFDGRLLSATGIITFGGINGVKSLSTEENVREATDYELLLTYETDSDNYITKITRSFDNGVTYDEVLTIEYYPN